MTTAADRLEWDHKVTDIRDRKTFSRIASAAECVTVSRVFGDAECLALSAQYEIIPLAPGRFTVRGSVTATIEQVCGVTLDPLEQEINEEFIVEFRSNWRRETADDLDFDALADDDIEPIEHGEIRLGRLLCEIVASAIDPFPRSQDAELERADAGDKTPSANPFAVLANLKGKT